MYDNKKKPLAVLLICCVILSSFQCNKRLDCASTKYNFKTGIKAYPDNENIGVGDTIFLELNAPVNLQDINSNKLINYNNAANFGTTISFAQLLSEGKTNNQVASNFRYLILTGNAISRADTAIYREYNFIEVNGYYKFKIAIIPFAKGIYKMFVSNASNVYRKNDQCTKANFQIDFENTNQHLHLNQVSFPDMPLPEGSGVYFFKVD